MKDFYLPVSREQGRFLYQTVRATGARRVVEFGSSFGVSTIYLAAGVRDNEDGMVIGSELVEEKGETARANLAAAGHSAADSCSPPTPSTLRIEQGKAILDLVEPWVRTALWVDKDHQGQDTP